MVASFSIKPIIRTDKPVKQNNRFPIYFAIRIGNKQIKIPAKKEVECFNWDKAKGRFIKSAPNSLTQNNALAKSEHDFRDFILKNEMSGRVVGIQEIKNYFNGNRSVSFYDFFKEVVRVKKLKLNTIKVYDTTYTVLKQFKPNLAFYELTPLFVRQFNHFLISVRGNNTGGVYNRHKILKCIIIEAIKNEIMEKNPYMGFPLKKSSPKKVFLNFNDIEKLNDTHIPSDKKHLQRTKDMFLFSCYTGIRFSDVMDLGWKNISDDSIDFKMNKTGKFISIPLIKQTKDILKRYKGKNDVYVFPIISNQKTNKNLKNLAKIAGISKHLTFHVSRHSFASNLVAKDVQLNIVRDLLGHSSVKETEVYAKNDRTNIVRSILQLENK